MRLSRLLNGLLLATFLVLPMQAAASPPAPGETAPAGVCASLAACEEAIDRALAANDIESLAMALWRKIAVLQAAGKREEADAVRRYLVTVLSQAHGADHAYTVAARNAAPEVGMQALLPVWQQRQRLNAESEARRRPILERLRAGKNMVKIAEAYFEIGKYEVTQAEWEAVMGTDPSHFKGCADCPVENIDGDSVRAFLVTLNQLTGRQYRLPSTEEWRRVFEAGFSGSADDNAWHAGNAGGRTHPVGQKKPNALGLYDLQGNVSEWVEDLGSPWSTGDDRLTNAGSSWDEKTPAGFWNWIQSRAPRYPSLGFRLARSLEKPPAPKKDLPACHDLPDAPKPVSPSAASPASLPKGFRDCPDCPEMVSIPAGQAMNDNGKMIEMPAFAIARTEVTVGQFRRFVEATGHRTSAEISRRCHGWDKDWQCNKWDEDWQHPGHAQTDAHPVVWISGKDARAYVGWLSKLTGQVYQLPTDAQWEYAARANSPDSAIWGDNVGTACRYANVSDHCFAAGHPGANTSDDFTCNDGYVHSAPVGSFLPNAFGLYDTIGNVAEWTMGSYCDDCASQYFRGGSASDGPGWTRFSSGSNYYFDEAWPSIGFRPIRVSPR